MEGLLNFLFGHVKFEMFIRHRRLLDTQIWNSVSRSEVTYRPGAKWRHSGSAGEEGREEMFRGCLHWYLGERREGSELWGQVQLLHPTPILLSSQTNNKITFSSVTAWRNSRIFLWATRPIFLFVLREMFPITSFFCLILFLLQIMSPSLLNSAYSVLWL